jgi:hypothetical protein
MYWRIIKRYWFNCNLYLIYKWMDERTVLSLGKMVLFYCIKMRGGIFIG